MLPTNVLERLVQLKQEMRELKETHRLYLAKRYHTDLEKTAHAQRQAKLLAIKQELANMMKRS